MLPTEWPFIGLSISTARLELRLPKEAELKDFAALAAKGIQPPGEPQFQESWMYDASSVEQKFLENFLSNIANWKIDNWNLPLGIFVNDEPIGMQHIVSRQFPLTRCFGSGVWIGLEYQGQGFGTEVGEAVLKFGFEGLEAREAYIGAWTDNAASLRVMEKLGYLPNGQRYEVRNGEAVLSQSFRFPLENWSPEERKHIKIQGLTEEILALCGAN